LKSVSNTGFLRHERDIRWRIREFFASDRNTR